VEFPGFSGQTVASAFSRRSDAEVQAPDPGESSNSIRIHQGASKPVQRTADVPRARGGAERLLRLADTTGFEPFTRGRPVAAAGSGVVRCESWHLRCATGVSGPPRAGETCSKHRVARLICQNNLRALHGYRTRRVAVGKPSVLIPNLLMDAPLGK